MKWLTICIWEQDGLAMILCANWNAIERFANVRGRAEDIDKTVHTWIRFVLLSLGMWIDTVLRICQKMVHLLVVVKCGTLKNQPCHSDFTEIIDLQKMPSSGSFHLVARFGELFNSSGYILVFNAQKLVSTLQNSQNSSHAKAAPTYIKYQSNDFSMKLRWDDNTPIVQRLVFTQKLLL